MNTKKKLLVIGAGVAVVLLIAVATVFVLMQLDIGQANSNQQQTQGEKADDLSGTPAELRQKALDFATAGDKDRATKYFNAAKEGFQKANDSVVVEEINMQLDQLQSVKNTEDSQNYIGDGQQKGGEYYSQ